MPSTQIRAKLGPPETVTVSESRRFVLHWNHEKEKTNRQSKYAWESVDGTLYSNGWVTLANATNFESMSELEYMLEQTGDSRVDWIDA